MIKIKHFKKFIIIAMIILSLFSESAEEIFLQSFPEFKSRMKIIYDLNDYEMIKKMSQLEPELNLIVST